MPKEPFWHCALHKSVVKDLLNYSSPFVHSLYRVNMAPRARLRLTNGSSYSTHLFSILTFQFFTITLYFVTKPTIIIFSCLKT